MICKKYIENSKLSRHIKTVHEKEERVEEAIEQLGRIEAMKMFLIAGINEHNEKQTANDNPIYQRKRKASHQNDFVKCSKCHITIQKRSFYRHRKVCAAKTRSHINTIFSLRTFNSNLPSHLSEDYKFNILEKFRNDYIGNLCRSDTILIEIGKVFFGKIRRKKDKRVRVSLKRLN